MCTDDGKLIPTRISGQRANASATLVSLSGGGDMESSPRRGCSPIAGPVCSNAVTRSGFDRHDRFFFIPLGTGMALSEIWRRRVLALFLDKGLLNPDFARKLLGWEHSGFSIESGTRIWDQESREALCQYIVRAPLSLQRIRWDEQQDTVTWSSSPSGYFESRQRRYSSLDFIAQVTMHIP